MKHELNITKGEWKSRGGYNDQLNQAIVEITNSKGEEFGTLYTNSQDITEEAANNAILITDAGNTYQSCGLTSSELRKQRDELLSILKIVAFSPTYDEAKNLYGHHNNHWTNKLSETLKNCE